MEFVIEKGIAPKPHARKGKYPFAQMEVGDSFVVPLALAETIRSAAAFHSRKSGAKFISRKEEKGVRIHRLA